MKIVCLSLVLLLFAASCKHIGITDNEDKGIKEVLELFGGHCKYSVGWKTSTKTGKEKYFELEMSKSTSLENNRKEPEISASGIAYTFYKNLKDEKNNYTSIKPVIIFDDGEKVEFKYPVEQLEFVKSKMSIADKFMVSIQQKKYGTTLSMLDIPEITKAQQDTITTSLKKLDSLYGDVKEHIIVGFEFIKTENGKSILRIVAQQERANGKEILYTILIDPEDTKGGVVGMRF